MSNTVKDGGTAFPMQDAQAIHAYAAAKLDSAPEGIDRDAFYTQARSEAVSGMSLRDYFAAKAMPVILADPRNLGYVEAAECSYDMADAMLSAREKQKPEEPLVPPPSYCKPSCPEIHREYGTSQAQKNGGPYICRKCGLHMPF